MIDIDVIVPVGARTDDLVPLHHERREALRDAGYNATFTYVIDGELPQVRDTLASLARGGDDACVIQLSRRFGETAAVLAGFANTKTELVMILPAFEQVETASLGRVIEALADADLVTVRRFPRCDSGWRRAQTQVFEAFIKGVGSSRFRDPGCTVHALRRTVLEETQLYGEQHGFLPLLAANVGFKVVEIDLPQARTDAARKVQRPRSYIHRLVDILSVFFLTRFTRRPLRFFGPAGAACTALGALGLVLVVVQRLFLGMPLAERPALILSSLLVAVGLQVLAIGLIGELIVFIHARSMRQYRVREIIEAGGDARRSKPARLAPVGAAE
ncbi:MAG TPA: glycosyltransferase [Gammaproteobacteria bacterium]|nr:glycosyltransferase [Gammaproteobacteria bacterium]